MTCLRSSGTETYVRQQLGPTEDWKINFLQRQAAELFQRMKGSHYVNASDKEIVEALERLFIHQPPKTDDPEDEYDYVLLRQMSVLFFLITIMRLIFAIVGVDDDLYYSEMYSMVATGFFTWLFMMLHFETNNPSRILLILTWAAGCFSLW